MKTKTPLLPTRKKRGKKREKKTPILLLLERKKREKGEKEKLLLLLLERAEGGKAILFSSRALPAFLLEKERGKKKENRILDSL